jgi:hypothetical protein
VAWLFYGAGANLILRITGSGMYSMEAIGDQDCRPSAGDFGVLDLVRGVQGIWSIHGEEVHTGNFEPGRMSLRQLFAKNRGRSCAEIHYFGPAEGSAAVVHAVVLMLPAVMERTINLAKAILDKPERAYRLSLAFSGLVKSEEFDNQPSFEDFAKGAWGHPYLSDDVTFSIMQNSSSD